jgi:hypothetical protein
MYWELSLGTRGSGQHAIDLLSKILEWDRARDRDCRLFLSGPTGRSHKNKTWSAVESPPVRLLAIPENGFEIFPIVETLGKRRFV